jgi:hypothetical protein
MMNGRARDLDFFKVIVMLVLIFLLFLFMRSCRGTLPEDVNINSVTKAADQPIGTTMPIPTTTPNAVTTTPSSTTTPGIKACPLAAPARIGGVGSRVRVTNALIPLRSKPAVSTSSYIKPLPIGSELEVLSLPVCEPYLSGANLWWQVRALNGMTGWAAEASASRPALYYLQEIN